MIFEKLGNVCDFQGGTQPPKEEWINEPKTGYIRMLQIRDFTQPDNNHVEYVKDNSKLNKCQEDDILIGRYGASVGKILTGLSGAYNVAIIKTIPDYRKLGKPYLYYFLLSPTFQNFIKNIGGRAAQAGFNKEDISNFQIPLPPLPDQIRIAEILSKAETLIAERKKSISLLDELIKSTFLEMFGDPVRNEKGWEIKAINQISTSRLGKMLDKKKQTTNKRYKYLANYNVQWFQINLSALHEMDFSDEERNELSLEYGDLLICEGGEVGRSAIWKNEISDCYFQKALHRLRANKDMANNFYICFCLWFIAKKTKFSDIVGTSTIPHLTGVKLKALQIPIPPLTLQNEFAAIVEKVEATKKKYQTGLEELENLYNSLSQRAFKGEL